MKLDVRSRFYAREVWDKCFQNDEMIYRAGIKSALGIGCSRNNKIAYIEAAKHPLVCKIRSQQYRFWVKINVNDNQ